MERRLILDEDATNLVMAKLAARPIHAGPDGEFVNPGVIDLLGGSSARAWEPIDERTRLLVVARDACQELALQASGYVADEVNRTRLARGMTVPLCSLMDIVVRLCNVSNDDRSRSARARWPQVDQAAFQSCSRRLRRTHLLGPVRQVRNKRAAHLDPASITAAGLDLQEVDLLGALGDTVVVLMLSLNYPSDLFGWIRSLGRTRDGRALVETMFGYPICVCWITDDDGRVLDVGAVRLADDPRHQIREAVLDVARAYNAMLEASPVALKPIGTRFTHELLAEERPKLG